MPDTRFAEWVIAASVALAAAGCGARGPAGAPLMSAEVVATVNGARVTEADLELKARADMHQKELKPEFRKNVLEAVIRDEVLAQKAAALGLDADPTFRAGLSELEAQLAAYRRKQLSERYMQDLIAKSGPTEVDARRYLDANAARLRTELHVWQILQRDEGAINQAKGLLDRGEPFDAVARSFLPGLPAAEAPWDLGYLNWLQIPEPWRPVLDGLSPGATSGVIRGPRGRYWIVKLVDQREKPALAFEEIKAPLLESLRNAAALDVRERAERELREKARIAYRPN